MLHGKVHGSVLGLAFRQCKIECGALIEQEVDDGGLTCGGGVVDGGGAREQVGVFGRVRRDGVAVVALRELVGDEGRRERAGGKARVRAIRGRVRTLQRCCKLP